jgi:hypothetical protein
MGASKKAAWQHKPPGRAQQVGMDDLDRDPLAGLEARRTVA